MLSGKKMIQEKGYWGKCSFFPVCLYLFWGHKVAQLVEALCYKPEIAGSIPDEVIKFFN
jgi:hypothetical protein